MKITTALEMQDIDRETIEGFGISGLVLMERAGLIVAAKIKELYTQKRAVILAGGGNNGGDGLVAARELFNSGFNAKVLMLAKKGSLSKDCEVQLRKTSLMGVAVEFRTEITKEDLHGAVMIDAIFGTGLNKDISGVIARIIAFLNSSGAPVLSVDIPSGLSADTGQVMGIAVKAAHTVTFGLPKRGHYLYPGAEYTGRLIVGDIGFPEEILTSDKLKVELLEQRYIAGLIPARKNYSYKGNYGHVLIVAGSRGKTGAALLAAKACMRSGAGLVTIGVPDSLVDVFQSRVTEEMVLPLPDKGSGCLSSEASDVILRFLSEKADILCIGPGIGVSVETRKLMDTLVLSSTSPMVIDADGINSISQAIGILRKAKAPIILTPHTGEMARLLQGARGKTLRTPDSELMTKIEQDRIGTALEFSKVTGTCLVLKGVPTVIAGPDNRAFVNQTGNPGMATAGTGDVLTGMVSSLLGQGLSPVNSAVAAVYLHGLAGDIAAREKGKRSLIASDIIKALPAAFRELAAVSK